MGFVYRREAWSQCENMSKQEAMRMYVEELQRVRV